MGILKIKLGARSRLLTPSEPEPARVALPGPAVVRFVVPGNPVPWERTVFDSRRTKRGRSMFITPKKTRAHKRTIQDAARLAGVRPFAGPVKLVASFYRATHQRCDVDNLSKSVQDALNGVAYLDDSQIVALVVVKLIDSANPRTEVEITEVA